MTHGSLLGFDTSTPATSVCVLRADATVFETVPDAVALARPPAHASELMPAVAELLARAEVGYGELDGIAVGVGPGTFTGLRIGVATARGLALAQRLELRPVSSLAALAAGMLDATQTAAAAADGSEAAQAEPSPPLLPLIDAKRGELFAALYDGETLRWPPFVATPEALVERLRREQVAPVAAGDGSVRFRGVLEAAGARVEPDGSPVHVVRALHICRLAGALPGVAPETVLPEYLRVPDAQPQ